MGVGVRAAQYGRSLSDDTFSVTGTAVALTAPNAARSALVTVSGTTVRYRLQGVPTAAVGHLIADGGNLELFGDDMRTVQFIATTGSAAGFVTFFGA